MIIKFIKKRITTNATTNFSASSCSIAVINIAYENVGSAWTLRIQDASATPFVLVPTVAVSGTGLPITYDHPLPMDGGINLVTSGTTPGALSCWIGILQPTT